jgi:hypothetical protein
MKEPDHHCHWEKQQQITIFSWTKKKIFLYEIFLYEIFCFLPIVPQLEMIIIDIGDLILFQNL